MMLCIRRSDLHKKADRILGYHHLSKSTDKNKQTSFPLLSWHILPLQPNFIYSLKLAFIFGEVVSHHVKYIFL